MREVEATGHAEDTIEVAENMKIRRLSRRRRLSRSRRRRSRSRSK